MGCPRESLYAPSYTLRELLRSPRFTYIPGIFVERVQLDANGVAVGLAGRHVDSGEAIEIAGDRVVLAAGALATTRLYLATLYFATGRAPELPGLMDNRQVSMPFVSPALVGRDVDLHDYQFHHIALGVRSPGAADVHGQITALKGAQVHPIVATLPFDMRTSLGVFRRIRAALGVVNFWLADTRRAANVAALEATKDGQLRLRLHYAGDDVDREATAQSISTVRRALRLLGAHAPRGQTTVLPRGSSVHYAGTIPMSATDGEHTCRADGSVRGLENLVIADGAGFPSLPAKNLTFTLMANAVRIAERACA